MDLGVAGARVPADEHRGRRLCFHLMARAGPSGAADGETPSAMHQVLDIEDEIALWHEELSPSLPREREGELLRQLEAVRLQQMQQADKGGVGGDPGAGRSADDPLARSIRPPELVVDESNSCAAESQSSAPLTNKLKRGRLAGASPLASPCSSTHSSPLCTPPPAAPTKVLSPGSSSMAIPVYRTLSDYSRAAAVAAAAAATTAELLRGSGATPSHAPVTSEVPMRLGEPPAVGSPAREARRLESGLGSIREGREELGEIVARRAVADAAAGSSSRSPGPTAAHSPLLHPAPRPPSNSPVGEPNPRRR